jgi:hypothetical protein
VAVLCSLDGLGGLFAVVQVFACLTLLLADSVLLTAGVSLGLELLFSLLLGLLLVDGLDKHVLVLVHVTLGLGVQTMVHVLVDLLGVTIPTEQSTENASAAHPDELTGHTGVASTLPGSHTVVATLALGSVPRLRAGARMDLHLSAHNKSVLSQLADVLAYDNRSYN